MTPAPDAGIFWRLPKGLAERTDLTPAAKLVYVCILDRIGENSEAWPGLRRVATACGIGMATACRAVAQLEAAGLLEVEHVPGNPAGRSNRYRLPERTQNGTYSKRNVPKAEQGRTQNGTRNVLKT